MKGFKELFSPRKKAPPASEVPSSAADSQPKAQASVAANPTVPVGEPVIEFPAELPKVTLEDFDLLKVLGKGGFGKVMLVGTPLSTL